MGRTVGVNIVGNVVGGKNPGKVGARGCGSTVEAERGGGLEDRLDKARVVGVQVWLKAWVGFPCSHNFTPSGVDVRHLRQGHGVVYLYWMKIKGDAFIQIQIKIKIKIKKINRTYTRRPSSLCTSQGQGCAGDSHPLGLPFRLDCQGLQGGLCQAPWKARPLPGETLPLQRSDPVVSRRVAQPKRSGRLRQKRRPLPADQTHYGQNPDHLWRIVIQGASTSLQGKAQNGPCPPVQKELTTKAPLFLLALHVFLFILHLSRLSL